MPFSLTCVSCSVSPHTHTNSLTLTRTHTHKVLVVTSEFHMPRAEAIFRHVFELDSPNKFTLTFHATPNDGLTGTPALKFREEKEAASLEVWETNKERLTSLADMSTFLFTEHSAYSARGRLASLDGAEPSPSKATAAVSAAAAVGTPAASSAAASSSSSSGAASASVAGGAVKNLLDTY